MKRSQRALLKHCLIERGLIDTLENSLEAIDSGQVVVNGAVSTNPNRQVRANDEVDLVGDLGETVFVSRGGVKLSGALSALSIRVSNKICLDLGASTGGFTDCLLQAGAGRVYAVDVGRAQLHERISQDPRVVVVDQTNARNLTLDVLEISSVDLVVADLSFISLDRVAAKICGEFLGPSGEFVLLVKPQFEAPKDQVDKTHGVIVDPRLWEGCLEKIARAYMSQGGYIIDIVPSTLKGPKGNREFFIYGNLRLPVKGALDPEVLIARAVARALCRPEDFLA